MKSLLNLIIIQATVLLLMSPFASAQDRGGRKEELLTRQKKEAIINQVRAEFRDKYFRFEKGKWMAGHSRE